MRPGEDAACVLTAKVRWVRRRHREGVTRVWFEPLGAGAEGRVESATVEDPERTFWAACVPGCTGRIRIPGLQRATC